jgi:hypothetical protein
MDRIMCIILLIPPIARAQPSTPMPAPRNHVSILRSSFFYGLFFARAAAQPSPPCADSSPPCPAGAATVAR